MSSTARAAPLTTIVHDALDTVAKNMRWTEAIARDTPAGVPRRCGCRIDGRSKSRRRPDDSRGGAEEPLQGLEPVLQRSTNDVPNTPHAACKRRGDSPHSPGSRQLRWRQ